MARFSKGSDGKFLIKGKKYEMVQGSRAQVWHGTAYETTGGLKKSSLFKNKLGRIVSASKHKSAKKDKRLEKAGFKPKKGTFKAFKKGDASKSVKRGSTAKRGRKGASTKRNKGKK
jgi:hypothetical protein